MSVASRLRAAIAVATTPDPARLPRIQSYAGRPLREAQSGLAFDPDDQLRYNQGGARYFRPITEDKTRDLSPVDQARMAEVAVHLLQTNPLAKRLIERRTNYALGRDVQITCEDEAAQEVLDNWRQRDRFDARLHGRVNAWRGAYGEALYTVTVNAVTGAVRTGFIAPDMIEEVVHEHGNLEALTEIVLKTEGGKPPKRYWIIREDTDPDSPSFGMLVAAPNTGPDAPRFERQRLAYLEARAAAAGGLRHWDGSVFFFRANALPNMLRGISDLWVVADYVDGYETIMWDTMDRAAIVNAFVLWWKWNGLTDEQVAVKAAEMGASVPKAGTTVHTNGAAELAFLSPSLVAAGTERFSDLILSVIATGAGVPDYWLNASVDPNRASAESMAVPVLRDMEELQRELAEAIGFMARFVLDQAVLYGTLARKEYDVRVELPPLGDKQAAQNSAALQQVAAAVATMRAESLLDRETAVRLLTIMVSLLGVEEDATEVLARLDQEREEQEEREEAAMAVPLPPAVNGRMPGQNGAAPVPSEPPQE